MRIEHTDYFNATPAALWPWLDEPDKQARWMTGVMSNELLDAEASRPGAHIRMRIREGGKVVTYDGQITAYDPPNHLGVRLTGGSFPAGAAIAVDYRLTAEGAGARLDYTAVLDASKAGLMAKVMLPMAMMFARGQLRTYMRNLQDCVEGRA